MVRKDITGRFYDLDQGQVVHAQLENFGGGQGRMTAMMPDGEEMKGEYLIAVRPRPPQTGMLPAITPIPLSESKALEPEKTPYPWPQAYGFGVNAEAAPVGTATLVGNRGTILEIVLYAASLPESYADGVARDNRGRRYRVHIGQLEEK